MTERVSKFNKSKMQWWVLCLCVAVSIVGIFDHDLWNPDEPRVAAISLEMSRTGNVVVPHLAGKPFVEKPPLYFAVAAGAIRVVGPVTGNTGAIRLTSALWGLGTLIMTFMIARLLTGANSAFLATAILATMVGFIQRTHWIVVDNALMFFVAASVWSMCEAYLNNRRQFLTLAGAFAAGAFLSKGIIGPVFIGIAWMGLVVPWFFHRKKSEAREPFWVWHHTACLLMFIFVAGAWIISLWVTGGAELWHAWFWDNHLGRFTGTALQLGHSHKGKPFFYIMAAITNCLPWTPLVMLWLFGVVRAFYKYNRISKESLFLLLWSVGSILFLSLSVTKRDLYLLPALPGFAIMASVILTEKVPRWISAFFVFWAILCISCMSALAFSPFIMTLVPAESLQDTHLYAAREFLGAFTIRHLAAAACMCAGIYTIYRRREVPGPQLWITISALTYIAFFLVGGKAMDLDQSKKADVAAFVKSVPVNRKPHIVGFYMSEGERGYFYFYHDWVIPQVINREDLVSILTGKDPQFDSVITRKKLIPTSTNVPCRLIGDIFTTEKKQRKHLYWVEGKGDD